MNNITTAPRSLPRGTMLPRMRYRLGLDLGSTSIGWCMVRLDANSEPCAVIRAGVRIFSDGRNPQDGTSLAVTRRLARQMRRRRDRLLKRKARLVDALVRLGFWPADEQARRDLARLDPYALRRKGLDEPLTPAEFGRAVFHLNQRRGFLSNRRTDRKDSETGLLKNAISKLREELKSQGARTVGEWLAWRHDRRESVRARLRGRTAKDKAYDLYIDRAMVAREFDELWKVQADRQPDFYTADKRELLRDILFYQRPLRPVEPGRCTLLPEEKRAPLALPSVQRFRIYQELNHLRIIRPDLREDPLTREQRDEVAQLLERGNVTFDKLRKRLGLDAHTRFNLEDRKRDKLKGNATALVLAKKDHFGDLWHTFTPQRQDEIARRLVTEQSEASLISWLVEETGIEEDRAERIASAALPDGFSNLSEAAIARILPELRKEVVSYAEAVRRAGFDTHSALSHAERTGEIMNSLPYYGKVLTRHVGFGTGDPKDPPEKRYGRIANPTVHIGLNELRKVVSALIKRYGHPAEIVVEVARELKQSARQRLEEQERQAERQRMNDEYRRTIAELRNIPPERVTAADLERMRLWKELNPKDAADRRCPYTGEAIGLAMLFSAEVEVDHILPFSMTLDDSPNNKTVCLRRANRDKGNRTPYEAFGHSPHGYDYSAILQRAAKMPQQKAKRFAPDGYQRWLREDADFLSRALNDTAYLSRIAKEYLSLVCPPNRVRVIPGRLTALLRAKFGLNDVLGVTGEKNREDYRHHAVDAAVVAVTDQGLLQRFAEASARAREYGLNRLVDAMPLPWPSYRDHVKRAVSAIVVSHKPDHAYEGALHNDTAYALLGGDRVAHRVMLDSFKSADDIEKREFADSKLKAWLLERLRGASGAEFAARIDAIKRERGIRRVKVVENLKVIPITEPVQAERHGRDETGNPAPYKGYKGDSNYCLEIWRDEDGRWRPTVISTFDAYRIAREAGSRDDAWRRLRHPTLAQNGKPLVMRLVKGDLIKAVFEGELRVLLVIKIRSNGTFAVADHREANVRKRYDAKDPTLVYGTLSASSLMKAHGRRITVSPIGDVRDPGFNR
ncbi:MAG: type II CRISPR RNA-guided endonuclease Cas9 [Burkholderiales bacterium]|nr:type II CRISPR RNA-guided endonuclease Cas9 [Burkholderiales bacterium]